MVKLVSVQVGRPRAMGDEGSPDWTSGIVKERRVEAVYVGRMNLTGDGQADLKNHGGFDKAVLGYGAEHYTAWQGELGILLPFGAFGENLTLSGWTEDTVCLGDLHAIGEVLLEVSQPRQPCWKLSRRWGIPDLEARVRQSGRTGWYYRVIREGMIQAGMPAQLVERRHPTWSVREASRVMESKEGPDRWSRLVEVPQLADNWRVVLQERLLAWEQRKGDVPSSLEKGE